MKSKTLLLLKQKGIFACLKYLLLKHFGKSIASLFYHLNVPLPQNFHFIFLTSHGAGHNAMIKFLKKSNIDFNIHFLENGKERYRNEFKFLHSYNAKSPIVMLSEFGFKDYSKYISLLQPAKVPALILIRDPISQCKSFVNLVYPAYEGLRINVGGGGQNNLYSSLKYCYTLSSKPCLDHIKYHLSELKSPKAQSVFILHDLISSFPNLTQKIFVDMTEISADRAFETMKILSEKLGFEPPKESQRQDYEQKEYGNVYFLLPLSLVDEKNQVELLINKSAPKEMIEITQKVMSLSHQNCADLERLKVYAKNPQDLDKISANLVFYQSEIQKTFDTILDIIAIRKANNFHEKDILKYFKLNPELARYFKEILEINLQELKQERPDIIESWKYYQEFMKICEELDK